MRLSIITIFFSPFLSDPFFLDLFDPDPLNPHFSSPPALCLFFADHYFFTHETNRSVTVTSSLPQSDKRHRRSVFSFFL